LAAINSAGQEENRILVCKNEAFAARKSLPKLRYQCRPDAPNDYDEVILRRPERIRAINDYMRRLALFNSKDWWEVATADLNICDFRGKPGNLSDEETRKFEDGEYLISLMGNDRIRLVLASDPCFQTGYNGSNAFLLYRNAGKVIVSQVLDGYFSRADNSVGIDFAVSNSEQIIEISTSTGGLGPYITNYYFVIDKVSRKAVPKNLFREGRRLTNKITSALIMSDLGDSSSSQSNGEMKIVGGNRLAKTFNIYRDDPKGEIDDGGRTLRRVAYRWNGQFYLKVR
jgi:hypothetical protein